MVLVPEIAVSRWFNTSEPLTLSALRGRPVLLHAFPMLCPGCVAHGTPQTQRAFELFKKSDLQVIGLHTVFEHQAAMTPVSLEAFIHEYKLTFPIGVDEASEDGPIPVTMARYGMRGTPTSILIGRHGGVYIMDSASRATWRWARSSRRSSPQAQGIERELLRPRLRWIAPVSLI